MKPEERQALQQNELAEEYVGHLKPFLEKYGRLLALGAVALVLLFVAVSVYRGAARGDREAGWGGLFEANAFTPRADVAELETVAELEANTGAAVWAHIAAGDAYLNTASSAAFTDRAAADSELQLAQEHYEKALTFDDASESARAKALYGLATVAEATAGGDVEGAKEAYTRLVTDYPDSSLTPAAELRLKALDRPTTGPFLAWFDKQNPEPGDLARPLDSGPAGEADPDDAPIPGVDEPAGDAATDLTATDPPLADEPPAGLVPDVSSADDSYAAEPVEADTSTEEDDTPDETAASPADGGE